VKHTDGKQNPKTREEQVRVQRKREKVRIRGLLTAGRLRQIARPTRPEGMDVLRYYAYKTGIVAPKNEASQREIDCPELFSFIESPDEAIDVLNQLVRYSIHPKTRRIDFLQDRCALLDHCAESAATALAIQARNWSMIRFRGTFPASEDQRAIVLATGMPYGLGLPLPEPDGFLKFRLRHGRRGAAAERSTINELQSTKITQYVDECLANYGSQLTARGRDYLTTLVSEVLDNAEQHSERRDWWIAGYLRQQSTDVFGDCHITIFNFGRTIAESLRELPSDALLRRRIEELVSLHRGRLLGGLTEDNLWTLYALQGAVSRFNGGKETLGDTRGNGTVQLIEFFQKLGKTAQGHAPKMCIVSGSTHILFDGTYQMRRQKSPSGEETAIIAFNHDNDLRKKPDGKYVRQLRATFPGTLISLRFYLDPDYLAEITGTHHAS